MRYSSGATKPTPWRVCGLARHAGEASISASDEAQIGVADEVPPIVTQPLGDCLVE